ncbi:MAG: fumarylacetoacetate hydrolase family protein, partial [Robiginitalea sp.]
EPFRVPSPRQEPTPLPYLIQGKDGSFDIHLEVDLIPEDGSLNTICRSNFKNMYWTMAQQLAHHTVNGCKVNSGDMMGSGTISGATEDSFGSMLELAWMGTKPIPLSNGQARTFIQDHDMVVLRGYCQKDGLRIGFGEVRSQLLPAISSETFKD